MRFTACANLILVAILATQTITTSDAFTTCSSSITCHESTTTLDSYSVPSVHEKNQSFNRVGRTNLFAEVQQNEEGKCENGSNGGEDRIDTPEKITTHRRTFLRNSLLFSSAALVNGASYSQPAAAAIDTTALATPSTITPLTTTSVPQPNLNCLLDLPSPPSSSYVRIYICRHGQTENNRLRLVQGSRIDPPLNNNGRSMGRRIGLALSKLDGLNGSVVPPPKVGYHSVLARAKETAFTASNTLSRVRTDRNKMVASSVGNILVPPASASPFSATPFDDNSFLVANYDSDLDIATTSNNFEEYSSSISLNPLSALGEVDFGPSVEGKSVSEMKAGMVKTWGSWSLGKIDVRPDGGGENARDVLTRISVALQTLAETAQENGGSLFAVSHSTYLRMLLATITDTSLAEAATFEQKNGCINVLDIDTSGEMMTLGSKCKLLGGSLSLVERDFNLVLPKTRLVRMNEVRHLEGVNVV